MKNDIKLLLVDSNALIHRAYHALPASMANKKGEQTNAVYGFTAALLHALETVKPTHVVCCFDLPGGTFRNEQYEQYKAHRKKMDPELSEQIPRIYEVVKALGIPIVTKTGFEADDLIGTLATKFENKGTVQILTGDKDTLQLLSDSISVISFKQGIKDQFTYTPAVLKAQLGMTPKEYIFYKALRGDPSDNIPGVAGIGEVTAQKLVLEFHSLDNLYQAVSESKDQTLLKDKLRATLIDQKTIAELSYKLSTIDTKVPLDFDLNEAKIGQASGPEIVKLFDELNFVSLRSRVAKFFDLKGQTELPKIQTSKTGIRIVDAVEFVKVLGGVRTAYALSLTCEGAGVIETKPTAVAVSFDGKKSTVSRWTAEVAASVSKLLGSNQTEKRLFDTKTWLHVLNYDQKTGDFEAVDVMLLEQLLQNQSSFQQLRHKGEVDDDLLNRAGEQAAAIFNSAPELTKQINQAGMQELWQKIEMPLTPVLAKMENRGVILDDKALQKISIEFAAKIKDLEKQIWHLAGQEFNIASPQQVGMILFEKLQISGAGVKKKTRGLSTDFATLEGLKGHHPIIDLLIEYRELAKLQGTYVDALPKLINPASGRLHTTYNQLGAATGRLSSTDPNLQNIPIRNEYGEQIRRAFVAQKGFQLLSVDYSQIELRILAHLSGDEAMKASFASGLDIHTTTAARIYNVAESAVTHEMRRSAKTINFGILYGLSAHSLSKQLEIDFKTAQDFIDRYFAAYPQVATYLSNVITQVKKQGYYTTLFGRRRNFADINSSMWAVRQGAERMAKNFPMQGTQADILKMAMVAVGKTFASKSDDVRLLLSVHDELLFEVKSDLAKSVAGEVASLMTGVCKLDVPLAVSAKAGQNWAEMNEVA